MSCTHTHTHTHTTQGTISFNRNESGRYSRCNGRSSSSITVV